MRPSRYIIIHKHRKEAEKANRSTTILRGIGLTILGCLITFIAALGIFYAFFTQNLPSLTLFEQQFSSRPEPTRFYARDGKTLLFTLAYKDFDSRDLEICEKEGENCFPQTFLKAARTTRETAEKAGEKRPLTEELIRQVYAQYINNSRFPELAARLLTFQIRQTYGDEQIESWYYNRAWFGQMAFGLDAAARLYLDKPAEELNDAECILMSAILNAPMLNPIDSKGALRDFYLSRLGSLQRAGMLDEAEAEDLAHSNFIIFEPPAFLDQTDPDIITRKAMNAVILLYGRERVERGGLKIVTTEDTQLQEYLRCITSAENDSENTACPMSTGFSAPELKDAAEALRTAPVSIAVLDVKSGEILAEMEAENSGDRSYSTTLKAYPAGTTMNFFAALTAFTGGSSPSTLLWDLENYYDESTLSGNTEAEPFAGPIQLREALAADHQRALSAHLQRFGNGAVQRNAALFGLHGSYAERDVALTGQNASYTAEEIAYSLIPFAAFGRQTGSGDGGSIHPVSILYIEGETGEREYPQQETEKSLTASNLAYLVHNIFEQETGNLSLPDRPSAVKVGRIQGESDRWISGYTTELSCAMHIADPQTVSAFVIDGDRVQQTADILWRSVMEFAHRDRPVSGWNVPEGISRVRICLPSGKLPTAACQDTMTDVFLKGNEPYEYDEYYVEVPVNRENRMLATRFTKPENIVSEIFLKVPEEAAEWAAANGIEQPPASYDPIRDEEGDPMVRIDSPSEFRAFAGDEQIDIIVSLNLEYKPESVQVTTGSGMYPTAWEEVCSSTSLGNGQWKLCTLDASELDAGLYALRIAFTFSDSSYRSAETYFQIINDRENPE